MREHVTEAGAVTSEVLTAMGSMTSVSPKEMVAGFPAYHIARVKVDDDGKRVYDEHPRLKTLRKRAKEQGVAPGAMMTKHVVIALIERGHTITLVGGVREDLVSIMDSTYLQERNFLARVATS